MKNKPPFLLLVVLTSLAFNFSIGPIGEVKGGNSSKVLNMDQDSRGASEEIAIEGEKLKAFVAAFEEFKNDVSIPEKKKRLENYTILFSRGKGCIYVFFYAKRLESERGLKGGEASLGRDMKYCVATSNYKVVERIFSK
jgi:hypothetical protein